MNGLTKEKRKQIEEKSIYLAKLKMTNFQNLISPKGDDFRKSNTISRKNQSYKNSQSYNITPQRARSISNRDDTLKQYSSQIKYINDLTEEEHESVMYKSNWMIPQEQKHQGEDENIKVSPFVKYHPAIQEMKVKSQDKRGYLLQEHQRKKKAEKQYLESLKDSKQFSLNQNTNSNNFDLSKLNRTYNVTSMSVNDKRNNSFLIQRHKNSFNQSNLNSIKGQTVPIRFNETIDDCLFRLGEDIKQQQQEIEDENRISKLMQKQQQKNPNYIHISISGVDQVIQNQGVSNYNYENIPIQNIKQNTQSDDESICSTDKHKQKMNELLSFSLHNIEFNENIHNYGQNFGKYPRFYKYLTNKNNKAQEQREYVNLKIYHQQLQKKKAELSSQQSILQSPNSKSVNKQKKGIFSQDYKTFGDTLQFQEISPTTELIQLQNIEELPFKKQDSNQQNSPSKKEYPASSFSKQNDNISTNQLNPEETNKNQQQNEKQITSIVYSDLSIQYRNQAALDLSPQAAFLKNTEKPQGQKQKQNQVLQKKNTIRENEEKSQKFISAFSSKYPYILKKLKQIYKEEYTTKPFTKNYDEVFLSIYESLSRANDVTLDPKNIKNK